MSVVQDIGVGLSTPDYGEIPGNMTREEWLESLLTQVCYLLGDVGSLTKGNADIEFILSIVGSYLLSKDKLPDDVRTPKELFGEILFPAIDSMEISKETIDYGDVAAITDANGEIQEPTTSGES
jgi:hypothetical protein